MRTRARRASVTPERAALVREVVALVAVTDAGADTDTAPGSPTADLRRRSA